MKQKRMTKVCSLVATFGMVSSMFATANIVNVDAASIDTEYDLVDLNTGEATEADLITNGDFEDNKTGWQFKNSDVLNSKETAASGNYHGLLKENQKDSVLYQTLKVKPNTDYVAKAKIAVGKVGGQVFFNVKANYLATTVNEGTTVSCDSQDQVGVYQEVEIKFNTGNYSEIQLCAMKWADPASGPIYEAPIYVDDVSMHEVASSSGDEDYDIVWAEEFNEDELDTDTWGYELGCIRGVEQQHYVKSEENVFMRDGNLVLRATDRAEEDQYTNPRGSRKVIYNSGSVRTHGKQEFLYGRIEMRAKLPKGRGAFPAFWTLGADFTLDGKVNKQQGYGWSRCGEIDIMELLGGHEGEDRNKQVWGTAHFYDPDIGDQWDQDTTGSGGKMYTNDTDFNDDYHVFGINWSPDKIEWYVDGVVYNTLDLTNPQWGESAKKCFNRPQYIQLNLAMGGNWPGDTVPGLAGTEFQIDYVYYAQNAEQKAAAEEYYASAPELNGVSDVTMVEGDTPDLLEGVTSTNDTFVDFSVENEHMFKNTGGLTSVDLLCTGKDDVASLANLPAGKYNIHYTAIPNDIEYDDVRGVNRDTDYKFTRKTAILTVVDRTFPSDFELNGVIGNKLESIALPEGWSWVNPETVIESETGEYEVQFVNGSYSKIVTVTVNAVAVDKTELENTINNAVAEVGKDVTYTKASRAALDKAIASARAVFEDADATKEEVANAIQALNNAIANLEKYVDEKDVNDLIEKGNSLVGKTDAYTKDSLNKLSAALADVKSALESGDKEAIQSAYARLNEAIAGLVKNDTTTDPGVTPSDPNSGSNSSTAVKTGDDAAIGTALFVLTMSAAGVVLFKKRKRC